MDYISKKALSAARKICGHGDCYAPYESCNHSNRKQFISRMGTETTCPLAKYNVQPEKNPVPWYQRPASETRLSQDDFFCLCADCKHATVEFDGDTETVKRTALETVCFECPVFMALESEHEREAEARMS